MIRNSRNPPHPIHRGDRIPAEWLNQVADFIVQNVSVVGGRFSRRGRQLVLDVGGGRGGGGVVDTVMGEITAVTGTSHSAVYDVTALRANVTLSSATPYRRVVDSGITITAASVGDWAMLANVQDENGASEWILWDVPEVAVSASCPP